MKTFSDNIKSRPKSPVTEEIINFYDANKDKDDYIALATEFVKTIVIKVKKDASLRESFATDRKEYSFYSLENYKKKSLSDDDFIKSIMAIHHWYVEIAIAVFPEEAANEKKGATDILIQQVSPPLSAYEMVPFNKQKITYSDESYGLLFE